MHRSVLGGSSVVTRLSQIRHCSLCHIAKAAASTTAAKPVKIDVAPFALKARKGYINGKWVDAVSGATLEVPNPATGAAICSVPDMGKADTLAAIAAAEAAFPAWAAKTPGERSVYVRKLFDLMQKHSDSLAVLLTMECGKPFEESKGEIAYAASFFEWFSEEGKRSYGEIIPPPRADRRMLAIRQPIGVAVR